MTQEEKLEEAKRLYKDANADQKYILERLFPGLAESKDERIRKAIIEHFSDIIDYDNTRPDDIEESDEVKTEKDFCKKAIDWLEKQDNTKVKDFSEGREDLSEFYKQVCHVAASLLNNEYGYTMETIEWYAHTLLEYAKKELEKQREQKPTDNTFNEEVTKYCREHNIHDTDKIGEVFSIAGHFLYWQSRKPVTKSKSTEKFETNFKLGDWIVTSYGKVNQIVDIDEDGDGFTLDDDTYFSGAWKNDYHLWTIQDAKEGDVLIYPYGTFTIFKKMVDDGLYLSYVIQEPHLLRFNSTCATLNCYPATKEQRDLLFQKMKEAGYEWDVEKKELKEIEHNPAWSEEDEQTLNNIADYIKSKGYEDDAEWLQSLRPQSHWKPSEEQMKALNVVINFAAGHDSARWNSYIYNVLKSLSEQLKKLKG